MSVNACGKKVHVSPEKLGIDVVLAPNGRDPRWRDEATNEDDLPQACDLDGWENRKFFMLLLAVLSYIPLFFGAVVHHNQIVRLLRLGEESRQGGI